MNKNVLIVLAGAVAVAVVVAMLVQVSLGGRKENTGGPQVQVLIAERDLGVGMELSADNVRWQAWPQDNVFPGAIVRQGEQAPLDAAKGRLGRNVAKGEPVQRSALVGEARGNFVAASLDKGMRAVAIEVSASSMVGGFLQPGDYVDVILTYKEQLRTDDKDPRVQTMFELNLDKMATETILQNIKIMAIDQTATRPDDTKIKIAKTVTLAVNAQEAERLSLASQMGQLTLSLRGLGDDKVVTKEWPTISDARLTNVADEIFDEYKKLKKDTSINPNIVRIYNGEQIQIMHTQ